MSEPAIKLGQSGYTVYVTLQAAENFLDRLSEADRRLLSIDGVESARRVLTVLLLSAHRVAGSATKVRRRDRQLDIDGVISVEPPLIVVRGCNVRDRNSGGARRRRRIVGA